MKIMYVRTNGYDMTIAIDSDDARYRTATEEFPVHPNKEEAEKFLNSIEDVSGWETDLTADQLKELTDSFDNEVIAEIETEL
jgi:hypothetical protein